MTTWTTLLAQVRLELKDPSGSKYSDDLLFVYGKDAIRDYSSYFPRRIDRTVLTLDANNSAAVPSGFIQDITIECPKDRFLERRYERPGAKYITPGSPTLYYISGGRIYLDAAPLSGDQVLLSYMASHALPGSKTDGTTAMTIPEMDEELIRLYIKASAIEQTRTNQANLDRFKLGSGSRDDNPMTPEGRNLMDEYLAKIAERTPGGVIRLFRPGKLR